MTETRIYTLAEVGTRLVREINDLRAGPEALAKYEADLKAYNRRRRGRPEVEFKRPYGEFLMETCTGFALKFPGRLSMSPGR